MHSSSKGQGLPLNVIILAALGLIVLVIVVMMFYGKSTKFSNDLESCFTKLGSCVSSSTECEKTPGSTVISAKCTGTQVCCVKPIAPP